MEIFTITIMDEQHTALSRKRSLASIESRDFKGRSGFTSVVIPDSLTIIEEGAFSGYSGLTSVVIPDSITSIGSCAF